MKVFEKCNYIPFRHEPDSAYLGPLSNVMGRGTAGARMKCMGRGNDAKTALRVIKETKYK